MESPPAARRRLRLRWGATCVRCGTALPAGAEGLYDATTKTFVCITCPTTPAVTATVDRGTAGASAQREHDRRAAKREAVTRERWGERVGGVVLALTGEPQTTRSWAMGARGERLLGEALNGLGGIEVLNDRRVPGTRGNIDHLVVAPAGVFVVDAKANEGFVEVRDVGGLFHRDLRLHVGGRDRSRLATNMGWQVEAVQRVLESVGFESLPPVAPVLCFVRAEWPLLFPAHEYRGVRLESRRSLRRLLTASATLPPADVTRLARILATAFPPK